MTRARKPLSISLSLARALCVVLILSLIACGAPPAQQGADSQTASDSTAEPTQELEPDSALDTLIAGSPDDSAIAARRVVTASAHLSPLADSLARFLVFVPVTQRWFAAASRGQRMLIDLGRVDTTIGDSPVRQAAYKEAVAKRAPIGLGEKLRLRGPWGSDDVTVSGFDVWSGRIVATVKAPAHVDSLARAKDWAPAVAVRSDSVLASVRRSCEATIPQPLNGRLTAVKDSVVRVMRAAKDLPRVPRLVRSLKDASSRIAGCFENATAVIFITLYAGDYEWVREHAFAIDSTGAVRQLSVRDLRFKSHETLGAFDADEDGDDDLAVRGRATRSGAMIVLRLVDAPAAAGCCGRAKSDPQQTVPASRLERAAAGFAWER